MLTQYVDQAIEQVPALEKEGQQLAKILHRLVLQGGEPVRYAVDLLPHWTIVMTQEALPDRQPKRIEVEEKSVLLYRDGRQVYVVSAVCPHAAAPLEEGCFTGQQVQCPWHDSVFDLEDGHVILGPATSALPHYEARLRGGKVEIRTAQE